MATIAFAAWWLVSRLGGLTNQLSRGPSNSNWRQHNINNSSHRVAENLTEIEQVMRSFRVSGNDKFLIIAYKTLDYITVFSNFAEQYSKCAIECSCMPVLYIYSVGNFNY